MALRGMPLLRALRPAPQLLRGPTCAWRGLALPRGGPSCALRPLGPTVPLARCLSSKAEAPGPGPAAAVPAVREVAVGMGQVVFCNSPLSGALITAGLAVGDPCLAGLALLGCGSATATARLMSLDAAAIQSGLFGYNGALVGCAFSVFLGAPLAATAAAVVPAAAASTAVANYLGGAMSLPHFTLAFNIVTLAVLAFVQPFAKAEGDEADAAGSSSTSAERVSLDPVDWIEAVLNGISQIFVVQSPLAGILIALGIAAYSQMAAGALVLGSAIGALGGGLCGADLAEVSMGLWGFNAALTSLAVSVFFVPTGPSYIALMCGGAALATALTAGLKGVAASTIASPSLTVPFCLAGLACFLPAGRMQGIVRARSPHSPEANWAAYRP